MVRYHFDIREDGRFVSDHEGKELPGLAAAETLAVELASFLGRDRLPAGKTRALIIEVRDDKGHQVATATVSLHTTRARLPTG